MSPAPEGASAIAVYGDLYVVGWISGALPGQTHVGKVDAYIHKYDAAGKKVWARQFGTSEEDSAYDIAVNSSGVYVSGMTSGTLPGQVNAGESDAYIRQYDNDGNEVWTRQFGSSEWDFAPSIAVDSSSIYVAGQTWGIMPNETNAGGIDAYIRKYNNNGHEIWTHQFGSSSDDSASAIAVNSTGIYVAGSFGADAYVRKYDVNGGELWTRQFGSTGSGVQGIDVDTSGIYVVGYTYGALPDQTHVGESDAYIRKYDLDGNEVWTRQFGTDRGDFAGSIVTDNSGIYVVGSTFGALPGQTGVRYYDAFVRKYDTAGNEIWTYQFGSMSDDSASDIVVDSSGLYIVGEIERPIPGDTEADPSDAFIVKLTKDAFEWEKLYLPAIHAN